MKYEHPNIQIEQPAPGHYVITGHHPAPIFLPDVGHVCPPRECYISPEVPSEVLRAILEDRRAGEVPRNPKAHVTTTKPSRN